MAKNKEIQQKQEAGALATVDYGSYANSGFENTGSADYAIPFLSVLQALSPQVSGEAAMDGAKAGMLFNSVTEDIFSGKEGIEFIPCYREHCYVEWVPRNAGGGYVGRHELDSEVVKQAKAKAENPLKPKTEGGNDLIETFYIYGLGLIEDRTEPFVIAFTSTKIAVYRRLMTKLNQFTLPGPDGVKQRPPLFAHRLRITTESQKNKHGTFYNFNIGSSAGNLQESLLPPGSELFKEAVEFNKLIASGAVKVAVESQNKTGEGNDDIPF